jgi:NTP pyrophosphatase (non-canonical NTP hydrolase)
MDFNDYQILAKRTMVDGQSQIVNYALGLAGETGETVDFIKKWMFHGHYLDHAKLESELGDVLWYVSALATSFGYSLEEIAEMNIEKLKARYPQGFSESDSINRSDV